MLPMSQMMKISELAKLTQMSTSTIRYYEKSGLLNSRREQNNYRDYQNSDAQTLKFIQRCKQSGFTLNEAALLLSIKDNKSEHVCSEAKELTQNKIGEIQQKIEVLEDMLGALKQLESICCGGEHSAEFCKIIKSLESQEEAL